jgi:hypothetical protein
MLDALHVVAFVLDPPRNLNLPSPNLPYPNLPSLNLPNLPRPRNLIQPPDSLGLPGCVWIAVNHLRLQQRDMLDALHAVVPELNRPRNLNQVPSGRVRIVVNYSLLLDMLDALHVVVFVVPSLSLDQPPMLCQSVPFLPFLPQIVEGTCRTDLRHWLLGHVEPNGVPSNLAAWTSSVPTVAPFIGMPR